MSTTPVTPTHRNESTEIQSLLDKSLPSYRQAYSDRTAWLMACLSELAYIKFNSLFPEKSKDYFLTAINKMVDKARVDSLSKLINTINYDPGKEKEKLDNELGKLNFTLVKTFDSEGTQAILVKNDKFIALAFRGTEATRIKDIKADADARITGCETGGNIHTGFKEAYEKVARDIQTAINAEDLPLFITGHSLGGALATIAAKKLTHKAGIAACYTYGSPRVGNDDWVADMKTPLYRIVNSADCVTMLPPSDECIKGIAWLLDITTFLKPLGIWLRRNVSGYLHCGNMRYMTNCTSGNYKEVQLLYSVSFIRRIVGWWAKEYQVKKFLSDHSIGIYIKKLFVIACRRNK